MWSKPIDQRENASAGWTQFQNGISKILLGAVKRTVASCEVDIPVAINRPSSPALPNSALAAIRCAVVDSLSRQGRCLIGDDPAVIRGDVAEGRPGDDHVPILQHQPGPVIFTERIKAGSLYESRPAELFRMGDNIDGVQVLHVNAIHFCLGHHVNRVSAGIDYRSTGYSNFRCYVATSKRAAGHSTAAGWNEADVPVHGANIRVDGVQAIVLGCHKNNIVCTSSDTDVR